MKLNRFFLLASLALVGCANNRASNTSGHMPGKNNESQEASATHAREPLNDYVTGETPEGEMLPGLPEQSQLLKEAVDDETPKGKNDLIEIAKTALDNGEISEALATLDVLVLMYPNDAEIIEMRGNALAKQGNPEEAKADFARCCSLGRKTCCR